MVLIPFLNVEQKNAKLLQSGGKNTKLHRNTKKAKLPKDLTNIRKITLKLANMRIT